MQLPGIVLRAGADRLLCHRRPSSRGWTPRPPVEDVSVMRMPLAPRATVVAALCLLGTLALAGPALAGPEEDLAARYAPVVRLVDQPEECGPGEPYIPTDVDVLFDEPTVALRGPWNRTDLVKIGPVATDLVNRYEYHLDFPGDPLDAGCDYELWSRRLTTGTPAHRLRPRRDRPRLSRQARAPVLVLLPVQRLQQHARGRLGDDPARLRRRRRRARR